MSRSYKKPWVKDKNPKNKRIHTRRYRRYIRQDLKQWRHRHFYEVFRLCGHWTCLEEYNNWECLACLSFELEPSYDPRNKWIDPWSICDWRFYCDRPKYRRK